MIVIKLLAGSLCYSVWEYVWRIQSLPAWAADPQWTHFPDNSRPHGPPENMPKVIEIIVTGVSLKIRFLSFSLLNHLKTKYQFLLLEHKTYLFICMQTGFLDTAEDTPSWHWRALPDPSCLSPWRTRVRDKCEQCLCVWAFRRVTSSLIILSTDPWWAYSGHYTTAATL